MAGVRSFFLRPRLGSEGVMQRLPFLETIASLPGLGMAPVGHLS